MLSKWSTFNKYLVAEGKRSVLLLKNHTLCIYFLILAILAQFRTCCNIHTFWGENINQQPCLCNFLMFRMYGRRVDFVDEKHITVALSYGLRLRRRS